MSEKDKPQYFGIVIDGSTGNTFIDCASIGKQGHVLLKDGADNNQFHNFVAADEWPTTPAEAPRPSQPKVSLRRRLMSRVLGFVGVVGSGLLLAGLVYWLGWN